MKQRRQTKKKTRNSRTRPKAKRAARGKRSKRWLLALLALPAIGLAYGLYLGWVVTSEFEQRGWDVPAQIHAAGLELYRGRPLTADGFVDALTRLGYSEREEAIEAGTFARRGGRVELWTRAYANEDGPHDSQFVDIAFAADRISAVRDARGGELALVQLDPMLIGSIFPAHGEDRLILEPHQIPNLVTEALIAVEDRRFERHIGVDVRSIARAALVNLGAGEIRQGASTLTQQLVRSYFLSTDRTWWRKLREAFMAVALELRHDKQAIMRAYVNEIYLGQDGSRAIHGFGLASRFYFGKPLNELDLEEVALLIAQVRGPSYYDPRRYPERALARRNLVLDLMLERGIVSDTDHALAVRADLGDAVQSHGSSYYAGFLDLVRRQLARDYAQDDLQAKGLRVFTTLDPAVQSAAEEVVVAELDRLQPDRPPLEGAAVVTNPHNGEVRALVGSRNTRYDGFNRALHASRHVGSLVKPAVYLAALETGRYNLASSIDDDPIEVALDDGTLWAPANFDGAANGPVTAVRALAESLNMATVRLGMDVGVDAIADLLVRLGLERRPAPYPSLLLGAVELTPVEVARLFGTLANGGFRVPLKSVRAVVDAQGRTLQRYPLEIVQAADAEHVHALNQALIQVMERGTGRGVSALLPPGLTAAGKTGTSDGLRDSWFAGFTGDHLVVTWIGNDANQPIGLTGASGAGRLFGRIVARLPARSYDAPTPAALEAAWIDYGTGLVTDAGCAAAVALPMPAAELPPKAASCGSDRVRIGSKIRRWFRGVLQ